MPEKFAPDIIRLACLDLIQANNLSEDIHLCVVAYFGMGRNYDPLSYTDEIGMHITIMPAPRTAAYQRGVHAAISTWRRISDDSMPPGIKTGANYGNSRLAQHEAVRNGFDVALLLNHGGTLAEAPGANVVMVHSDQLISPPTTSGALEGITVAVIGELAKHLRLELVRRDIGRVELYAAEELFLCGTLCEIQPIVSIDQIAIANGMPGPITRQLQLAYDAVVRSGSAGSDWAAEIPQTSEDPAEHT